MRGVVHDEAVAVGDLDAHLLKPGEHEVRVMDSPLIHWMPLRKWKV